MENYTSAKDPAEVHALVLVALYPIPAVIYALRAHDIGTPPDPKTPDLERGPSPKRASPYEHFMNIGNKTWLRMTIL